MVGIVTVVLLLAVVIALGALLGAGLGIGLGLALVKGWPTRASRRSRCPVRSWPAYVLAAAAAGALAAIGPARRASDVDVLRAVVTD